MIIGVDLFIFKESSSVGRKIIIGVDLFIF